MDPLSLLFARQNVARQVRDTADGGQPAGEREPAPCRAKDGKLGPVVQVGWWRRLASRWRRPGNSGAQRPTAVAQSCGD